MVDQNGGGNFAPNQRPDYSKVNPNTGALDPAQTPFPAAAGAAGSGPTGTSIPEGGEAQSESDAFKTGARLSLNAVGNSGTQVFGGYFSEEYLNELRGRTAARKWDEMRRSEAQISMLLNAMINPIKAANWEIESAKPGDATMDLHAELARTCVFDMIDINTFKHESLTCPVFGFAIFEIVHSVEYNHPKFGTFNGLKALGFRSQKTIENWIIEPKTGRLLGVNQYTYSDLGGNNLIPGEFLLVITNLKEGDNYEGISILRPMLGAYKRKELYLKLAAIGIEKYAVGTPMGTVPAGKEKTPEFTSFEKVLQNYTSHELAYLIKPAGWEIEIIKGDFDASKVKEMIVLENTEMANAMVANFLALGMNGTGGAFALGSNLGEFFTTGIQSYADTVCDAMNRSVIPNLIKLNYGDQPAYPKMKITGISDKAGKELAEVVKFLVDARALDPDDPLKEFLRKLYKMPKPDKSTAVVLPAVAAGSQSNTPKPSDSTIDPQTNQVTPPAQTTQLSEKRVLLADRAYAKAFDATKDRVKSLMIENLEGIYDGLKVALRKRYASLSGSDKILAAKGLEAPGSLAYRKALKDLLSEVAAKSIVNARKQVPAKKNVKLAEYDALPPKIRKLIDAQSVLLSETQISDLEKAVFFQFTSEATVTEDIDAILNAVDEKVEPMFEEGVGAGVNLDAAAGNAVAHVQQQSSLSFLMDDEVKDELESFTFENEDPVSDICSELAGTTFAIGDPDLDRYTPPLHHNCKSRLVPNLKGDSSNPEIDRGGVSLSKDALKSMTLSEWKPCRHRR